MYCSFLKLHLIVSDDSWLQVVEIVESKTAGEGRLQYIVFHYFTLNTCVSLNLEMWFCSQSTIGSCFFIYSDNIYLFNVFLNIFSPEDISSIDFWREWKEGGGKEKHQCEIHTLIDCLPNVPLWTCNPSLCSWPNQTRGTLRYLGQHTNCWAKLAREISAFWLKCVVHSHSV